MRCLLLFPRALRQARIRRGLLQKAMAFDLGLNKGVLCGVESGARWPLADATLAKAAEVLGLKASEIAELRWKAHHDRLLLQSASVGASSEELALISANLSVWHRLTPEQRAGWLATVNRMNDSACAVAHLSAPHIDTKGAQMT